MSQIYFGLKKNCNQYRLYFYCVFKIEMIIGFLGSISRRNGSRTSDPSTFMKGWLMATATGLA